MASVTIDGREYNPEKLSPAARTLVYDLQYRLRCSQCNRREGFAIAILDSRMIGTTSHRPAPRVIIEPKTWALLDKSRQER
jgi:hypothetical protein